MWCGVVEGGRDGVSYVSVSVLCSRLCCVCVSCVWVGKEGKKQQQTMALDAYTHACDAAQNPSRSAQHTSKVLCLPVHLCKMVVVLSHVCNNTPSVNPCLIFFPSQ